MPGSRSFHSLNGSLPSSTEELSLGAIAIISSDWRRLAEVVGEARASHWLASVGATFPACRKAGNLQPADRAMGSGPFRCWFRRHDGTRARAVVAADGVFGNIREIWARNVYLEGGFVALPRNGVVVDLGANRGVFTMLALAFGDPGAGTEGVRTISVEADTRYAGGFARQIEINGWGGRSRLINQFAGGPTMQPELVAAQSAGAPTLSQVELVEMAGGTIDFLKCDIEGSEYALLQPGSPILRATRQLSMEVHKQAGNPADLIKVLVGEGFECRVARESPHEVIVQARRRGTKA